MPALFFLALLAVFALSVQAADSEKFGDLPEPPPPAKNYKAPSRPAAATEADPTEALPEPEVHITTDGGERREEYRMGGRLYMIKVFPKKGPPYYLVDKDGKGALVRDSLRQGITPPMWVIKQF